MCPTNVSFVSVVLYLLKQMHSDKRSINYTPFMDSSHGAQYNNLIAAWFGIVCLFVCFGMAEVLLCKQTNPTPKPLGTEPHT